MRNKAQKRISALLLRLQYFALLRGVCSCFDLLAFAHTFLYTPSMCRNLIFLNV